MNFVSKILLFQFWETQFLNLLRPLSLRFDKIKRNHSSSMSVYLQNYTVKKNLPGLLTLVWRYQKSVFKYDIILHPDWMELGNLRVRFRVVDFGIKVPKVGFQIRDYSSSRLYEIRESKSSFYIILWYQILVLIYERTSFENLFWEHLLKSLLRTSFEDIF